MNRVGRHAALAPFGLLLANRAGAQSGSQGAPSDCPQGNAEVDAGGEREGNLLIHSIVSAENWRPVLDGFNWRHPRIRMETHDLPNSRGVFERYLAECGTTTRTASAVRAPAPQLGEYSHDILREGDFSAAGTAEAVAAGLVGTP